MNTILKKKIFAMGLSAAMLASSVPVATVPAFAADEATYKPVAAETTEVKAYMTDTDDNTVLVDARLADAYQGWALDGVKKGGHLQNAVSVPALSITNPVEPNKREGTTIEQYQNDTLVDAGLTKEKSVIVYDTNDKDAAVVAKYLVEKKGYKQENVKVYNAKELIDGDAKVESYPNYDLYVPAEVVKNISDVKTGAAKEYTEAAKSIVKDAKKSIYS